MSRSNVEYLQHALDEITFLETQSEQITEEKFMHDEVLERAFARSLEIIGESNKSLMKFEVNMKILIGKHLPDFVIN